MMTIVLRIVLRIVSGFVVFSCRGVCGDVGELYAWYRPEGIEAEGVDVRAWGNGAATGSGRSLGRVAGEPRVWRVERPGGVCHVVRLDGKSALWQPAGAWGSVTGDCTVVAMVRVVTSGEGFLFDGSTRSGMTRLRVTGGAAGVWGAGVVAAGVAEADGLMVPTHPVKTGEWQVHAVVVRKGEGGTLRHRVDGVEMASSGRFEVPLGGFILGADVATKRGLVCDVGEVLVFSGALDGERLAAVEGDLAKRWGRPEDLPEAMQLKRPGLPDDPRIFRTTVRKRGDDGVHTYRIPGLATTPRGTLIAVFDARNQGGGDLPGDIDVGMMRSTDDGATWGAMQRIMDFDAGVAGSRGNGVGDPAVLVDAKTGVIFVAALWSKGARAWHGSGPGLAPEETGQLMVVRSTDDGVTWGEPVSITRQVKQAEWRLLFNGPGKGIQLRDGALVFPAQFKGADNVPHACFVESRDGGASWKLSPPAIPGGPPTSEAQIAECRDGSLLLTMRDESRSGKRSWARWSEGKWSEPWLAVTDPTCMASLISHPEGVLLFSNPNSASRRERLTIRHSVDDGGSWSEGKLLDPGVSMYSCLTVLRDGRIGLLYERGDTAGLEFARFPLAWVMEAGPVKR